MLAIRFEVSSVQDVGVVASERIPRSRRSGRDRITAWDSGQKKALEYCARARSGTIFAPTSPERVIPGRREATNPEPMNTGREIFSPVCMGPGFPRFRSGPGTTTRELMEKSHDARNGRLHRPWPDGTRLYPQAGREGLPGGRLRHPRGDNQGGIG